jgi:hypothetical protein
LFAPCAFGFLLTNNAEPSLAEEGLE